MITRRFILAALLAAPALPVLASEPTIFKDANNVAVNGTDVVSYFTDGRPIQGRADFSVEWMGATWLFASAEHRGIFDAAREAYAPQYGGHCAYAAAQGALASSVPEAWSIVEGKLYLNYSLGVRDLWRQDIEGNIAKADAFWPVLSQ